MVLEVVLHSITLRHALDLRGSLLETGSSSAEAMAGFMNECREATWAITSHRRRTARELIQAERTITSQRSRNLISRCLTTRSPTAGSTSRRRNPRIFSNWESKTFLAHLFFSPITWLFNMHCVLHW